ncbi:putative ribosomal N-acetyltransferase YdaF [bioreactor metagenome]|uniref:Putative ribosomal N-acetyltransferase YdaF n=1 Tax=bioreactor metagenome TaxID=1076179 RepID=A0A645E868_9ZZZZ
MKDNSLDRLANSVIEFKKITPCDAEAMFAYLRDEDVSRYIGWQLMSSVDEVKDFIGVLQQREAAKTHQYASVTVKATGQVIGNMMLFNFDDEARSAEVGYVFSKACWNQGYGTQSLKLLVDYSFKTLRLHRLHAALVAVNGASARILEKNGFLPEGCLKDAYYIDDQYFDSLIYGLINPAEVH